MNPPPLAGEGERTSERFSLDEHVFFWLTQVIGRRNRALAERLKPHGLTIQQWRVLAVLDQRRDCTMSELAELTSVDRTTLTRTLDGMEDAGLVVRGAAAEDRRSRRLALTRAGTAALRRILPLVVEQNARAVAGFAPAEIARLRTDLKRMFDNLG